jgi:hypothetical protein
MASPIVDRRGEAHLWLLLEEALLIARGREVEPWEAWRNFRAVADALVGVGAVEADVAEALVGELDDALAVRGVIPSGAFTAAPWPDVEVLTRPRTPAPPEAARAWLEAEVERHLDLFVSFGTGARGWAAADMLRILAGPVRAFAAVGLLRTPDEVRLLDDVAATLAAAGVDPGRTVDPGAVVHPAWLSFLRSDPAPLPDVHEPAERRRAWMALGATPEGDTVRIDEVAWSERAIDVDVTVRRSSARIVRTDRTPWSLRVVDEGGALHLGQPAVLRPGTAALRFSLRPGLVGPPGRLEARVTHGGAFVEATVVL